MKTKWHIFFLLCLCKASFLFAQDNDLSITHFNASSELGQNIITCLNFDYDGYLWIGSPRGLIRYDGRHFEKFNLIKPDETNKEDKQNIVNIFQLPSQRLTLVKTRFGNIHKIQNGIPVVYKTVKNDWYSYLQTKGAYPNEQLLNQFNIPEPEMVDALKWNTFILHIMPVNTQDFVVLSEENDYTKLYYYKNGKKIKNFNLSAPFVTFFRSGGSSFYIDRKGEIFRFNNNTETFEKAGFNCRKSNIVNPQLLFFEDQGSGKTFWLSGGGLYELVYDSAVKKITVNTIFNKLPFNNKIGDIIFNEKNNSYYFSTLTEGLYIIKKKPFKTTSVSPYLSARFDREQAVLYCIASLDSLTAITASGVTIKYSKDSLPIKKLPNVFSTRETIGIRGDSIICVQDKKLFFYLKSEQYKKRHVLCAAFNDTINAKATLLKQQGDSLWVGTIKKLSYIKNGKETVVLTFPLTNTSTNTQPLNFYNEDNKDLWLGNFNGLYVIHKSDSIIKVDTIKEMFQKQVRFIKIYKNYTFLAVHKWGLYIYYKNHFYAVPLLACYQDVKSLHSIYIDDNDFMWLPTNNGLFKTTVSSVLNSVFDNGPPPFFYYYGKEDGIENTEFNGSGSPSYTLLKDILLYPSMGGIVSFIPNALNTPLSSRPLDINGVYVNGSSVTTPIQNDSVKLNSGELLLKLNLSSTDFINIKNIIVEYSFDKKNWILVNDIDKVEISLSGLRSGWHEISLRKRSGFETKDFAYSKLHVFIGKKITEYWWFYPGIILIIFGVVSTGFLLYNKNLRRKRRQLQKLVDIQTSELKKNIETKEMLISIISHDMIAPLKYVSFISDILQKGIEKDPGKINNALSDIKQATDRVISDSTGIINWMKYSTGKVEIEKMEIDLHSLTQEMIDLFKPIANEKNLTLTSSIPEDAMIVIDPKAYSIVLNNIISNAIKNTNEGSVEISLHTTNAENILIVRDTGKGISKEELANIQKVLKGNFVQVNKTSKTSTGLGFLIIGKLLTSMNSKIVFHSTPDKGTEIKIISPVT